MAEKIFQDFRRGAKAWSTPIPSSDESRLLLVMNHPQAGRQCGEDQGWCNNPGCAEGHMPVVDGPCYADALGEDENPGDSHEPTKSREGRQM